MLLLACGAHTARADDTLDQLFARLKLAPDEATARDLENDIWEYWTTPEDPALKAAMTRVLQYMRWQEFTEAETLLNDIIAKWPAYAEAWNQRATVHFLRGDYEQSLEDIAETLAREPRHFGAMAGRAVIRLRQAKPALARQTVLEALKIHPWLRERQMFPDLAPPPNAAPQ
ncbi:MAG: tetratricopeptide repeat protein [Magnetospiraceae bacterium]